MTPERENEMEPVSTDGMDTCPKCGSTNIEYTGTIADGELATYHCSNCGHHWQEIR